MRSPKPREGVYDLYWRFTAERQRVFEQRAAGLPGPWTDDRILRTYKFCNVFRAADRVSQYLIRNIANAQVNDEGDRAFQIVAFRTFSRTQTWDELTKALGGAPRLDDLRSGVFEEALTDIKRTTGRLYTGAFILCATDAYGKREKHRNHAALFADMFLHNDLAAKISSAGSLNSLYQRLHSFPLMGDFMSYQTAIDLNYSDLVNFSEDEFTQPGPGALRGIKKVFEDTRGLTPAQVIHWMVDHQEIEMDRLGLSFNGLRGRRIHAIDAQNLFCETDKYCREAVPALASARTRIKSKFTPTATPIEYLFPQKWGLEQPAPALAGVRRAELVGA